MKTAQAVLSDLAERLSDLDALDAPIAAAHLDTAIEALCRQFNLARGNSTSD
ncbi:MAG: hypothetical protein ABIT04_12030 [Novosphingobium sp.]